jgi:uncharacterized protein YutE (UPF0331/DUF86 family)
VVDRNRVLAKLDELRGYLNELRALLPVGVSVYPNTAVKRACERLLQLCIECVIDISKKLLIGNKLGIPVDEVDVFEKLKMAGILSVDMQAKLKKMRGLRNVLVHEYTDVDDRLVLEVIVKHLDDFKGFMAEVTKALNTGF